MEISSVAKTSAAENQTATIFVALVLAREHAAATQQLQSLLYCLVSGKTLAKRNFSRMVTSCREKRLYGCSPGAARGLARKKPSRVTSRPGNTPASPSSVTITSASPRSRSSASNHGCRWWPARWSTPRSRSMLSRRPRFRPSAPLGRQCRTLTAARTRQRRLASMLCGARQRAADQWCPSHLSCWPQACSLHQLIRWKSREQRERVEAEITERTVLSGMTPGTSSRRRL